MLADEGYFFGIGAFETIAVEEGYPILLEEHYRRLERALYFLHVPVPVEKIGQEVEEALARPEMKMGRQVLKITVSEKNLLVTTRKNPYGDREYEQGFATDFSTVKRNETSPFTYHKTLNYGDCIWEKRKASRRGIQEPVFCNTRGVIAEGASTNVFFVKNGRICTPSVACGLLPGILREYLCSHYEVEEREIYPGEVPEMEEMFLTNSLMGVMPAISLVCVPGNRQTAVKGVSVFLQDLCQVGLRCGGRMNLIVLNQILKYTGRDESRQCWAKVNIFDSQVQQS